MIKLATAAVIILLASTVSTAGEWVRILNPSSVSIGISQTKKVVEINTWIMRGHKNFVNLSFWDGRGPVGRLIVDSVEQGHGKKKWPIMALSPYVGEYTGGEISTGFSGSNVLVRNGIAIKQGRSFFSRRRCPRTGIGVTRNGMIIVIVSTAATMKGFAKKFVENGAEFALNVDGGSSTMFIENGESLWNSRRSAVPVILSW